MKTSRAKVIVFLNLCQVALDSLQNYHEMHKKLMRNEKNEKNLMQNGFYFI